MNKVRAASDRVGVMGEAGVGSGVFQDSGPHESFTQRPGWVDREEETRGARRCSYLGARKARCGEVGMPGAERIR